MKEMIYDSKFKREVLDTGYCLGLLYYIIKPNKTKKIFLY